MMETKRETQPTPRQERAGLITALNQQLAAINRGEMPDAGREDILARRRALNAEQSQANKMAKRPYSR